MGKNNAILMMAAMMSAMGNNDFFMEREKFIPIFCGDCEYCPTGNKKFCKLAGHNVCKTTPAHNCRYYKSKNIVED